MEDMEEDLREMWIYFSEKGFLKNNGHILNKNQMREIGIAMVVMTEEQKKNREKGLTRLFYFPLDPLDVEEPLYLKVPGKKLGEYEAAIADLNKAIKKDPFIKDSGYLVPIRIFASY